MPSWERFYRDWKDNILDVPFITCTGEDLYTAYRRYCERGGEKPLPSNKAINMIGSRHEHGRKWVDIGRSKACAKTAGGHIRRRQRSESARCKAPGHRAFYLQRSFTTTRTVNVTGAGVTIVTG